MPFLSPPTAIIFNPIHCTDPDLHELHTQKNQNNKKMWKQTRTADDLVNAESSALC